MSGKTVHKLYLDYEKEERWLNEMAGQGWRLVRCRPGSYRFEQDEPGEWVYRIELLPADPRSPATQEYLSLLLDSGAETVSTHARWLYLRRRAALGSFELFSDLESRIEHCRRRPQAADHGARHARRMCRRLVRRLRAVGALAFQIPMVIVAVAIVVLVVQALRVSRHARGLQAQLLVHE